MHLSNLLPQPLKQWIESEVEYQINGLFGCAVGTFSCATRSYPYPRLVRTEDDRARKNADAQYRSVVAKVLERFAEHYGQQQCDIFEFPEFPNDQKFEAEQFEERFEVVREEVSSIATSGKFENGSPAKVIQPADFERSGIKQLFKKLDRLGENAERQQNWLSLLAKGTDADALVRLVLFAAYLMNCVVLARIETRSENHAFDIFDAANSICDSLVTAEAIRPRVVQFGKFNERQLALLSDAIRGSGDGYTIESHRRNHAVACATARADLLDLVDCGFLYQGAVKAKATWFYPVEELQEKIKYFSPHSTR